MHFLFKNQLFWKPYNLILLSVVDMFSLLVSDSVGLFVDK